jgi:lipopolysaccharide export system protein LptA
VAGAQTFPSITIERENATFSITNRGNPTEGARSIPFLPGCEEGVKLLVYYGPGRQVETVINGDTRVTSTVVLIRQSEKSADQETIELLDSVAEFELRPPCLASLEDSEEAEVRLEQGRTTVRGRRLFLDQEVNVANMIGPIFLERSTEGSSPRVTAEADEFEFDLDSDQVIMVGNVRVQAGDRFSQADRLELNETEGMAVLTGYPARSTEGGSVLEGDRLLYYLDSNEVVVLGNVRGTFEIDNP